MSSKKHARAPSAAAGTTTGEIVRRPEQRRPRRPRSRPGSSSVLREQRARRARSRRGSAASTPCACVIATPTASSPIAVGELEPLGEAARSASGHVERGPSRSRRAARARARPRGGRRAARAMSSASLPSAIDPLARAVAQPQTSSRRRSTSARARSDVGVRRGRERLLEPAPRPRRSSRAPSRTTTARRQAERRGRVVARSPRPAPRAGRRARPRGARPATSPATAGSTSRSAASASARYHARCAASSRAYLAGRGEPLARVLADRLQQPVAVAVGRRARPARATCRPAARAGRAPPRGRRCPRPPRRRSRPRRRRAGGTASRSGSVEQVVAPVERRAQRLLAGEAGAAAGRRAASSASPSRSAICAGDSTSTRAAASSSASGMPSSRRQISATAAALSSVSANALRRPAARCAEQPHRLGLLEAAGGAAATSDGTRQATSPRDPQPLAAGGEDAQVGQARSSALGERGAGVDQVLAVVEHEQHARVADQAAERGDRVAPRSAAAAPSARGGLADHERRVADRGELDEPDAVCEAVRLPRGQLEREPRLARSRRGRSA